MNRIFLTQSNYNTFGSTPAILVVKDDIVISVSSVDFADGCIFEPKGGIISSNVSGGTIFNGNVQVVNLIMNIFKNIIIPDLLNNEVPIEWFGGVCYLREHSIWENGSVFSDQALANAAMSRRSRKIKFQGGYYLFQNQVTISNEGIILSGTMSNNRPNIRDLSDNHDNGKDSVSTLAYKSAGTGAFINITCKGTRLENLLIHELDATSVERESTAVMLSANAVSIYVERCKFYNWGRGILRNPDNETTDSGLTRSIISECFFHNIKYTAIEANVEYITYNIIRDSWISKCGCPIRLVASIKLLQDNTIENCNIDHVMYTGEVYNSYNCCCAIYMESAGTSLNYANNNVSRCYFEHVGYDTNNEGQVIFPSSNCVKTAAIVCLNGCVTVDNNFFTSTPRYFLIDTNSSISINDNGIGINNSLNGYPLNYNALVQVINSNANKNIQQSILYNNSIPLPPTSYITQLTNFDGASANRFSMINLYETRFADYGPQTIKARNCRSVATIASALTTNIFQVDYNSGKYAGSGYYYHSFRMYISLQYSVYCDVYEVTIDMLNLWGNAMLIHDNVRSIYGDTGLSPSNDITIKLKREENNNNRLYIYVSTPGMNPTFKVVINSDDMRVTDASDHYFPQNYWESATNVVIRRHRGAASVKPSFNASQNVNSKGYEYYDTTNSRKSVWNGLRWLTYKAEPEGAATSGTTSQRPTSLLTTADKGFAFFDTTLGKPVYWNGSGWVNANGTAS